MTLNNGINLRFNNPYQLKNLKQPKADEEKTEPVVEQKVDAQKEQVGQPKMSSNDVLGFMEKNAVNVQLTKKDSTIVVKKTTAEEAYGKKVTTEEVDGDGNKTITVEQYNKQGQLVLKEIAKYNKQGIPVSKEITEYTDDGLLKQKISEKYHDSGKLSYRETLFYPDSKDREYYRLTKEFYNEDGKWFRSENIFHATDCRNDEYGFMNEFEIITTSETDKNGNKIDTHQEYVNGVLRKTTTTKQSPGSYSKSVETKKYDSNGNLVELINEEYNERGKIIFSSVVKYDEEGNVLSSVVEKCNYDEQGNLISKQINEDNKKEDYSKQITENYDSQGRLIKQEVTENDDKGRVTKTTVEYSYTFLGLEKLITVENPDGSKEVTEEKQDRKGNVTSKVIYKYNKHGKLVDTVVEVEDKTNKNKINPNAIDLSGSKIDLRNLKNNKIER